MTILLPSTAPILTPLAEPGAALLPLVLSQEGAPAEGEPAQPTGGLLSTFLMPTLLIIGIFYVVLILPERKKQKRRQEMLGQLKKGDRVMTTSGMFGSVVQMQDDVITLQIAEGVRVRFSRAAVQTVIVDEAPKETPAAT